MFLKCKRVKRLITSTYIIYESMVTNCHAEVRLVIV